MSSLYERLRDVEKRRDKECRPLIRAYMKGKGAIAYIDKKRKYDTEELKIVDVFLERVPVLKDMLSDRDYLRELQKRHGLLTWQSGYSEEQKKLDGEFYEILGMKLLDPAPLPVFGPMYRNMVSSRRMKFITKTFDDANTSSY